MAGLIGDAARAMIPLENHLLEQQNHLQGQQMVAMEASGARSGSRRKEERIPQWSFQETRELIAVRAEFEREFTQTKRNKMLWELIAGRMREKGFRRSADQCKCKWKNLVNRYKGKEISEPDNGRQCPFYDELDAIFKERSKNMDRLLLESDGSIIRPGNNSNNNKRLRGLKSPSSAAATGGSLLSDSEISDDEEDLDDESEDDFKHHHQQQQLHLQLVQSQQHLPQQQQQMPPVQQTPPVQQMPTQHHQQQQKPKKRKSGDKERQRSTAERSRASSMQEVLEDFFQQQQRMEEQWREAMERREAERRGREAEWRSSMEKLEQERVLREQVWWEREEQRRVRDELRSRKRDELLEAVLRKLIRDD